MTEVNKRRAIKSYVVRSGRLTHSQEKALKTLWPVYGLSRDMGPLNVEETFSNNQPLVLEIGFGMGDSLAQMAQKNPQKNYIGVEVHPPGVGNLLRRLNEYELNNVRIYQDDAKLILQDCIADNSLEVVQIFFPDPWHKKRHHKRRLIQSEFIAQLLPKIKAGGLIHLATDWENYAEQMMQVLSECQALENSAGDNNFATQAQRPQTKFQRRGEKLGHGVWDLIFKKRA